MSKTLKRLVSADLLEAAAQRAEQIMADNPKIREAWLDQIRTSAASKAAGGPLLFLTDWDWVAAFFIWRAQAGDVLPCHKDGEVIACEPPVLPQFEAKHGHVFQLPLTKGDKTSMGFRVLSVNDHITDGVAVAATLASLMNRNAKEFTDG